jgi:DNA end-binding protein Ku
MPRAIWKGSISFGLVTIPVEVLPAESPRDIALHLLDERDMAQVHNKRVNAATGEEVPWDNIVKGYQLSEDDWVVVTDADLKAANVEATQTIDVLAAVCADEIDPEYFSAPYYLAPEKAGRKAYALLREALVSAKRVAIAKVVIRTRQHLAAIIPQGDVLILEILRYPYELRGTDDIDVPAAGLKSAGVTKAELELANQLVAAISKPFDPADKDYADTYHDDLLALIKRKAKGGKVVAPPEPAEEGAGKVVDIVSLLKSSLDEAKKATG